MQNQAFPAAKRPDLCVFIGRFEPPHAGHIHVISQGLATAARMVVLAGSANEPRSVRNPFTAAERIQLIADTFPECADRLAVLPLEDSDYNLNDWLERVHQVVAAAWAAFRRADPTLPECPVVSLIGHAKDATSYYLDLFPSWQSIDVPQTGTLSATAIREKIFGTMDLVRQELDLEFGQALRQALAQADPAALSKAVRQAVGTTPAGFLDTYLQRAQAAAMVFLAEAGAAKMLPRPTLEFLRNFVGSAPHQALLREHAAVAQYKWVWRMAPYAPIFATADAVVVQSGHVLMVKRRSYPGKGLWALPGGFVEATETLEQACLRELKEETAIKVPPAVLAGRVQAREVFDAPFRSSRGRTITHAFLIHLPPGPLAKVKRGGQPGDEETSRIKWIPMAALRRDKCFEDHYPIIRNMVAKIRPS